MSRTRAFHGHQAIPAFLRPARDGQLELSEHDYGGRQYGSQRGRVKDRPQHDYSYGASNPALRPQVPAGALPETGMQCPKGGVHNWVAHGTGYVRCSKCGEVAATGS
jgi:hypothetical protein